MKQPYSFSDDRPKLYYRATCARCRVISSVLIALSVVSFGAYRFRQERPANILLPGI
jgi:hypothetical protein